MFRRKMLLPSSAFLESRKQKQSAQHSCSCWNRLTRLTWSVWRLWSQSWRIPYRSMFRNVGGLYRTKRSYSAEYRSFPCHRRRNSNSTTQNRRDGTSLRLQNHSSVITRTIPCLFLAPHTLSFLSRDFEISSCALFLMKITEVECVEEFSLLRFNAV
jgi:hypothetical protein